MLKIRRSRDRLILNMGIPILERWHLYIETVPCSKYQLRMPQSQWIVYLPDRWEFQRFFGGHWHTPCTAQGCERVYMHTGFKSNKFNKFDVYSSMIIIILSPIMAIFMGGEAGWMGWVSLTKNWTKHLVMISLKVAEIFMTTDRQQTGKITVPVSNFQVILHFVWIFFIILRSETRASS